MGISSEASRTPTLSCLCSSTLKSPNLGQQFISKSLATRPAESFRPLNSTASASTSLCSRSISIASGPLALRLRERLTSAWLRSLHYTLVNLFLYVQTTQSALSTFYFETLYFLSHLPPFRFFFSSTTSSPHYLLVTNPRRHTHTDTHPARLLFSACDLSRDEPGDATNVQAPPDEGL